MDERNINFFQLVLQCIIIISVMLLMIKTEKEYMVLIYTKVIFSQHTIKVVLYT